MGIRKAFKPQRNGDKPPLGKKDTAVFTQMLCGHALIGAHLKRIGRRSTDDCWFCAKGSKMTRGHLFGGCATFRAQYSVLMRNCRKARKDVQKKGRMRLGVRHLFEEEGYEEAVMGYLKETGIGYFVPEEATTPTFVDMESWVGSFPFSFDTRSSQF
jgi:hypothetical protein